MLQCELGPSQFESIKFIFEFINHILRIQVISFKLLDDN